MMNFVLHSRLMTFVQPRDCNARRGLAAQAAIVFSVLVGAMGYLMQAYTARRASHARRVADDRRP